MDPCVGVEPARRGSHCSLVPQASIGGVWISVGRSKTSNMALQRRFQDSQGDNSLRWTIEPKRGWWTRLQRFPWLCLLTVDSSSHGWAQGDSRNWWLSLWLLLPKRVPHFRLRLATKSNQTSCLPLNWSSHTVISP